MADARRGLHLGYFYDDKTQRASGRRIYEGERHAIVLGPTGTGKTTRLLMANLLSDCLNDHSVIVIDPKGELAAVTAKYRHELRDSKGVRHQVKILDPFGKLHEAVKDSEEHRYLIDNGLTESTGFNPMASLDAGSKASPNPDFYDDAAAIGEALIKIEGTQPHWSESAKGLVVGLVMWEKITKKHDANLENIREVLTEPDRYEEFVGPDGKPDARLIGGLRFTAMEMVKNGGYEVASLAARFASQRQTNELASIRSTADTQTAWILSRRMRADLKKSPGIDFAALKQQPTTVYVILPAERMRTHSVWLRLVIVSALRSLYQPGGRRTVFLIDEMAALGHLGPLEDAFGLVRGYRVQIVGFLQDLVQLKALYPERWESFLANCGVIQGLTPNDLTTADWMSKRSGQATALVDSISAGTSTSPGGPSMSENLSTQQIGRPRFSAYEILGLGEGMGLYWIAGMSETVRFFAPYYSQIGECDGRYLRNPFRDQ
jgi:type IV secretion system protein VirD4